MAEKSFTFYCLHFNITRPLTVGDTPNWYKKRLKLKQVTADECLGSHLMKKPPKVQKSMRHVSGG